jgi:hypothetical protein
MHTTCGESNRQGRRKSASIVVLIGIALASCARESRPDERKSPAPVHETAVTPPADAAPLDAAPLDAAPGCGSNGDCRRDEAHGVCVTPPRGERQWLPEPGSFVCYCDEASHECTKEDVPALPCRNDNECGAGERHGLTFPLKLAHPRRSALRPCRDGETIPKCQHGTCAIVAFKC